MPKTPKPVEREHPGQELVAPESASGDRAARIPEELRRERIREQILRLVPSRYKISVHQLFNDTTCNITYEDFFRVLRELQAEGKIRITPSENPLPKADTGNAFDLIEVA